MTEEMRTFEIDGVKVDVDLRRAKRHETFTVGCKVKLLIKGTEYHEPKVHQGVITGFEPFKDLPTIIVMYLSVEYGKSEVKFAFINKDTTKKYDIVLAVDDDMRLGKADMLEKLNNEIVKHEAAMKDAIQKRDMFIRHFNVWFEAGLDKKETV